MPKIKGSQIKDESVTGDQILNESIDENDIKDGSIKAAELSSEAITGQTLHSGATDDSNDMLLIYDHSNTALRKIPLSELMGPSGLDDAIEDADQDTGISVDNGFDEDKIRFRTANSERAIIDNLGNFGIGTSSPSSKLDVSGNTNITGNLDVSGSVATNTIDANGDLTLDASGGQIYMKDNGVTYLTFNVNGITDSIDAIGNLKLNASADIYINAQQGDIFFQDNGTTRMRIEDTSGDVAIGSHSPVFRLDVIDNTSTFVAQIRNDSTAIGADLLVMDFQNQTSPSGQIIYVYGGAGSVYSVQGDGDGTSTVYTTFTGFHDTATLKNSDMIPGMIVESTGIPWVKDPSNNYHNMLPYTRLCSDNGSPKVFGVTAKDNQDFIYQPDGSKVANTNKGGLRKGAFGGLVVNNPIADNHVHLSVMSLGEGAIWITNINGNINNGDLIESSEIAGYGRLQSDDIMRSKTVAKCTENINWDGVTDVINHNGIEYKKYLTSCTFHCG